MPSIQDVIDVAAATVRQCWDAAPRVGIILGTGLSHFAERIAVEARIGYDAIPHFPRSTALGHTGRLICGTLRNAPVVAMDGRFHLYEGYSPHQVTLPVRVMHRLGVKLLIVSNASGGLNPRYRSGDIMVIDDHLNLMFANPLAGQSVDRLASHSPAHRHLYDRDLIEQALEIARRENFVAHRGTYVAMTGPSYETRAEYRFLRQLGGDVVGMSTVPEVIVAAELGLRVLAISTVTNLCQPDAIQASSGEEVVAMATAAEAKVCKIITNALDMLWPPAR